jgi:predicted LPLAT superfamily acyltransferase
MLPATGRFFKVVGSRISEALIYPIAKYFMTKTNRRRIEIHVLPAAGNF